MIFWKFNNYRRTITFETKNWLNIFVTSNFDHSVFFTLFEYFYFSLTFGHKIFDKYIIIILGLFLKYALLKRLKFKYLNFVKQSVF